jgi:hypothetical protein
MLSDYSSTKFLKYSTRVLIELITHQIVSFALRMHPETWIGQSDGLGSVSTLDLPMTLPGYGRTKFSLTADASDAILTLCGNLAKMCRKETTCVTFACQMTHFGFS